VVRFNAERAPDWRISVRPAGGWWLSRGKRTLSSAECAGVWWRRPEAPAIEGTAAAAEAVADQWRALIASLSTVPGPIWVSLPARIREAEDKARQLRFAAECGLPVPDTLWTNDLATAVSFAEGFDGQAVVKSVATAWWEEDGQGKFVFASMVKSRELPTAVRLAGAPVCFQQPIWPKRDVRVTVVASAVLGAIREQTPGGAAEDELDWRRDKDRPWTHYELPTDISARCAALIERFGLQFSGIDLAVDDGGTHWFLELNPNGEWGWLQRSGLRIAETLADLLLAPAR
jgi:glutathione synthase/RimK-type ligase-like ATP-grasp enzyme